MSTIWTVAKRELLGYFISPVAYVFLVIFLLLTGFFTFMMGGFFRLGEANLNSFFFWHPWLYLILVPAIGMRLWAEERRQGTLELLFTMPITVHQAVLGKFLAGWLFLGGALLLTAPMPISVCYLGHPDIGPMLTGYLGSFFVAGCYLTVSGMTSALTRNQVISFVLSVILCLFLALAGFPPVTQFLLRWGASNGLVEFISACSIYFHFESLQRGIIDFRNLLYFACLMIFCLNITTVCLKGHR